MDQVHVRFAQEEDCPALLEMIRDFARQIGMLYELEVTEEALREALFEKKQAEALLGEVGGRTAAYIVFFQTFATFRGRLTLFMEDLYVREEYRRSGVAGTLLKRLSAIAAERNACRIEWCCMDSNLKAIEFYRKNGAKILDDLSVYRLDCLKKEGGSFIS